MKIKNGASIEENLYRQNIVINEEKKAIPGIVFCIISAMIIALFIGYNRQIDQIKSYGIGNPYNCESCKELGRACSKHKGYDSDKALYNKIYMFIDRYNRDEIDDNYSKYALYGYGNQYNTDCDFCKKENKECHSCEFDRIYITESYERISNSNYFYSLLCDECWIKKKADCDMCKEMLTNLIIEDIRN